MGDSKNVQLESSHHRLWLRRHPDCAGHHERHCSWLVLKCVVLSCFAADHWARYHLVTPPALQAVPSSLQKAAAADAWYPSREVAVGQVVRWGPQLAAARVRLRWAGRRKPVYPLTASCSHPNPPLSFPVLRLFRLDVLRVRFSPV